MKTSILDQPLTRLVASLFLGCLTAFTTGCGTAPRGSSARPIHATDRPPTTPVAAETSEERAAAVAAWPSFRGPNARGYATGGQTPTEWDVAKNLNIRWRTPLPGLSHSSPIVWGDRMFLTNAVREDEGQAELKVGLYGSIKPVANDTPHQFQVICLDRASGQVLWTKKAWAGVPKIARHPKGSHAASTPATDGKYVVAFFGSEGLYAYDFDGKLIWQRDLGVLDAGFFRVKSAQWGFASSPVIHGQRVYVQCDVQGQSFVAALSLATGAEIWRTERDEVPTWGTPTVDVTKTRRQLIVNGWKHIGGYQLDTGEELWKVVGGGDIPVPTPVVWQDLVFITNAHGRYSPILAVSTAAEGEFSMAAEASEHMVWSIMRGGSYMQTPLVVDGLLFCCRDNGVLSCFDARTGERFFKRRLGGGRTGFSASGVAADGKLYYPSEAGDVYVVRAAREFEQLAVNALGETCMASPAIAEGTLYFRTRSHLIAVAAMSRAVPGLK